MTDPDVFAAGDVRELLQRDMGGHTGLAKRTLSAVQGSFWTREEAVGYGEEASPTRGTHAPSRQDTAKGKGASMRWLSTCERIQEKAATEVSRPRIR